MFEIRYEQSTVLIITLVIFAVVLVCVFARRQQPGIHTFEGLDSPNSNNPNIISVSTTDASIDSLLPQTGTLSDTAIATTPPLSSTTLTPPVTITVSGSTPIAPGTSVYAELPGSNTPVDTPVVPISTAGKCLPPDGEGWSRPGGYQGTVLNSPCCQAPDYNILDETLPACDNRVGASSAVATCLMDCCQQVNADRGKYDASWYPMARCGCALACNYIQENHFSKHGTAWKYIQGQPGDVRANESRGNAVGSNWRGFIPAFK